MSPKILFVIGSFRQASFHRQFAKAAEQIVVEKGAEVSYLDYEEVPFFNQDKELPTPPAVEVARQAVMAADAIWFFVPVYNHSVPGILKNLLDWLSRALDLSDTTGKSAIHQKITTVSSVAHDGQEPVFEEMTKVLKFIRTRPVGDFTATPVMPESAWEDNQLSISAKSLSRLERQASQVLKAIDAD